MSAMHLKPFKDPDDWCRITPLNLQMDVAMARSAFRAKSTQSTLAVRRVTSKSLVHLFVHNNVDLNTTFGCALQDMVQTPMLSREGRSSQEEFRR